jgi:hypothetical protein
MALARLLLGPTAVMGTLTSVDRCYCWICGTRTVATSAHTSNGHSDISDVTVVGHVAHAQLLLAPTAAMGTLTSVDLCTCWTCGTSTVAASAHSINGHSDISRPLLLLDMWHTHGCYYHPWQQQAL